MNKLEDKTVLALDIGGTKTLAALVRNGQVILERTAPTNSSASAHDWINNAVKLAEDWKGQYSKVSAAVTGLVDHGLWSPLNPLTLQIPENFPLTQSLTEKFGCDATAMNDAQAAAWGEYRYGAGQGEDMVFLTVSTGVGGGIIVNGNLLQGRNGLAGHFGVTHVTSEFEHSQTLLEDTFSGRWMARQARLQGHKDADAKVVFSKALAGRPWASDLVNTSALRFAALCANIQLMISPQRIVVGGGIGLAPGYLGHVQDALACIPNHLRPHLVSAMLDSHAGAIGAADFAANNHH